MRRALVLARRGFNLTASNPLVGALIVRDGIELGRGFHLAKSESLGLDGAHAEVAAIRDAASKDNAGADLKDATIYVTLEPCNHQGTTGACSEAILKTGISRVVYAMDDPNPKVRGGGASCLEEQGVEVTKGVLRKEAESLNQAWLKSLSSDLPYLTLKMACSQDGKINKRAGQQDKISSALSRAKVQRTRAFSQAILVGTETVKVDSPHLSNRSGRGGSR